MGTTPSEDDLRRVFGVRPRVPPADRAAQDRMAWAFRADPLGYPTDNRLTQTQNYAGVPYLAIRKLADAVAGTTPRVTYHKPDRLTRKALPAAGLHAQDERHVPVPEGHPAAWLVDRPNPVETVHDLLEMLVIQLQLTGTGLLWKRPNAAGKTAELWVVPTALASTYVPPSPAYPRGAVRVYNWQPGFWMAGPWGSAAGCVIPREELAPLRYRHPLYRWDAISPQTAGAFQLDTLNAIDTSRKSAMDHGFTPDAIVSIAGGEQDQLDRMEAFFGRRTGPQQHRKVAAVNGDKADVKMLNTSPREMDYSQGWEQMTKYTLALFGVPPSVVGLTEATSYAQLYAALQQFHVQTLHPLCAKIGRFLTHDVLRPDFGRRFAVQLDLPRINDQEAQRAWATARPGPLYTFNELRAAQGLPPVGPEGDVPADAYGAKQLAAAQPKPPAPEPVPGAPGKVSRDTLPESGPPRPANPEGAGSLPPRPDTKAMSALNATLGGALVAPASVGAARAYARRAVARLGRPRKRKGA